MPTLVVVAGPNGCGKSTLTRTKWFHGVEVIDPDAIARGAVRGTLAEAGREAVWRRRFVRSLANLPAAIGRSDEVRLYDNSDPDLPHRKTAVLADDTWWTAEILPDWAAAAIARVPPRG